MFRPIGLGLRPRRVSLAVVFQPGPLQGGYDALGSEQKLLPG